MRLSIFFFLISLIFAVSEKPIEDDEHCTPGEAFLAPDNCNSCSCPESGLKVASWCTLMACFPVNETPPWLQALVDENTEVVKED